MEKEKMVEEINKFLLSKGKEISDELLDMWYVLIKNNFATKQEFKEFLLAEFEQYANGDLK
ncbi:MULTISPECIES: hypothetical protein [Bacillus cereus group]|uniref:Uncharacterized protein n=1 Tax=Bacillus thuringiensis TaxID=1428 RepID=A0A9X6ZPS3_BACTU|nr:MULTISPECIES: hypothetical protein [Bacillus cereus group]PFJ25973.1 hypothetical protein COJ15_35225 [Bacillus thuringiensis]PGP11559.1 hypothetical protein COA01_35460 [Bacillus cereus]